MLRGKSSAMNGTAFAVAARIEARTANLLKIMLGSGEQNGSFESMITALDVCDDVVLKSVDGQVGYHLILIFFPASVLLVWS